MNKKGFFVIGDPHFQEKAYLECESLIEKTIEAIKKTKPLYTIILGDSLDTHEKVKQPQFEQVCRFIDEISQLNKVFVLMGNHDLINQNQYLTTNHFFNPLKKWKNVEIIDYPKLIKFKDEKNVDRQIVLCPYVPTGRVIDALDELSKESIDWTISDIIFGHFEMKGSIYRGGVESEQGDDWDQNFPPLISGHIHNESIIGNNVFYVGSSRQILSSDHPDKYFWHILFHQTKKYKDYQYFHLLKIKVGLKTIKEVDHTFDDILDFDFSLLEKYYITIIFRGTKDQFKVFKKGKTYK